MMKKIILFPFGGNAKEALDVINDINNIEATWDVVGFIDESKDCVGREYCGVKVLGGEEILREYPDAKVLAVQGNPDNYKSREDVVNRLEISDDRFATIVHPSAVISTDAKIGNNTLLMANVVVSSAVSVGNHCIILPNTTISHDSSIDDYCCLGSNIAVAGFVNIGKNCFIGSGSSIKNNILIGECSLVGLGSCVVGDVKDNRIVVGNPAKEIINN